MIKKANSNTDVVITMCACSRLIDDRIAELGKALASLKITFDSIDVDLVLNKEKRKSCNKRLDNRNLKLKTF